MVGKVAQINFASLNWYSKPRIQTACCFNEQSGNNNFIFPKIPLNSYLTFKGITITSCIETEINNIVETIVGENLSPVEAQDIAVRKLGGKPKASANIGMIAFKLAERNKLEQSIRVYEAACSLSERDSILKSAMHVQMAKVHAELGLNYNRRGNTRKARKHFCDTRNMFETSIRELDGLAIPDYRAKALYHYAKFEDSQGNYFDAEILYHKSIDDYVKSLRNVSSLREASDDPEIVGKTNNCIFDVKDCLIDLYRLYIRTKDHDKAEDVEACLDVIDADPLDIEKVQYLSINNDLLKDLWYVLAECKLGEERVEYMIS